jgi:hypothetical protein
LIVVVRLNTTTTKIIPGRSMLPRFAPIVTGHDTTSQDVRATPTGAGLERRERERKMKTVVIKMRNCSCGRSIHANAHTSDFFPGGRELNEITIEGHCGQPSHAKRSRLMTKEEFDRLPEFEG